MKKNIRVTNVHYVQAVIGPPGSGKSTYCHKMLEFMQTQQLKANIINLDPANDNIPYTSSLDVRNLVKAVEVAELLNLGPNGSLVYSMEILEKNIDWLITKLQALDTNYFIFDCPGQTELYTHHCALRNIFQVLETHGFRLCVVNLMDSHCCSDPSKFISGLLMSLSTMLHIGLPHVNFLSKADQLKKFQSKLKFNLDFYTDVLDLKYLVDNIDDGPKKKYKKLNSCLISMIEDYSLISFHVLDIFQPSCLVYVKNLIDRVSGYSIANADDSTIS